MYNTTFSQLFETSDDASFKELIGSSDYDFRFECGITKPAYRLEKQKTIDAMCLHFCVLSSLAELEQLCHGLAVQKFAALMELSPHAMRRAFQPPLTKVSSEYLQDLYVPIFSPK